jgi:hypothetical protein
MNLWCFKGQYSSDAEVEKGVLVLHCAALQCTWPSFLASLRAKAVIVRLMLLSVLLKLPCIIRQGIEGQKPEKSDLHISDAHDEMLVHAHT